MNFLCERIVCLTFLYYISEIRGKKGECLRKVSTDDGFIYQMYCCSNYEMRNGTCNECKQGFTSKKGERCKECIGNTYGEKCLRSCNCKRHQSCNNVVGCINLPPTTWSFQSTLNATATQHNVETNEVTNNIGIFNDTATENNVAKSEVTNGKRILNDLLNRDIVLYPICVASLLVVITICYIIAKRFRNKSSLRVREDMVQQDLARNELHPIVANQENVEMIESVYDEIEELVQYESKDSSVTDKYESSSQENADSEVGENLNNDGYLNPYQPMIEDKNVHDYTTSDASRCKLLEFEEREIQYVDILHPLDLYDLKKCLNKQFCPNFPNQTKVQNSKISRSMSELQANVEQIIPAHKTSLKQISKRISI
ncbi:unnamed protein product [Mytilus coruscus]|uniref:MEGF10_11 n=1 Tax=Mytilus coruscus TaxID=42192 RepID=A0A6J8E5X2_MYTCO|nr:unnamed protein product [Mytilus coruscus]